MSKIERPEVIEALKKYPEAKRYYDEPEPSSTDEVSNKRYVYEWYTVSDNAVFYVGRGVRNRYRHILWDLKKRTRRGLIYREKQEQYGIDCRIVYQDLTYHESKILAYALIKDRLAQGALLEQDLSSWDL